MTGVSNSYEWGGGITVIIMSLEGHVNAKKKNSFSWFVLNTVRDNNTESHFCRDQAHDATSAFN